MDIFVCGAALYRHCMQLSGHVAENNSKIHNTDFQNMIQA